MLVGFDHVTVVVTDLDDGRAFFRALGFEEQGSVLVSGGEMSRYMGIDGWVADHVTLVHPDTTGHLEVQLLRFHHPELPADRTPADLARLGLNHVCFEVTDLDDPLAVLASHGITVRNDILEFRDRRLVFLNGPDGVVVELSQVQKPTT